MYCKHRILEDAVAVFSKSPQQNVSFWNFVLKAYVWKGQRQDVVNLLNQMQQGGVMPSKVTYSSVFSAYASWGALAEGKQMHACIQGTDFESDVIVGSAIINMYGKCGSLEIARGVFEKLSRRDVVAWNAMLAVYAQCGLGEEVFQTFDRMLQDGRLIPNKATLVSILAACSSQAYLTQGRQVHSHILHSIFEVDTVLGTALVNMYGKCGTTEDAWRTFIRMPERNSVTWNVVISLSVQHGQSKEALQLFHQMQTEGVVPDCLTFVNCLAACAGQTTPAEGEHLHARILNSGLESELVLENALVNMYGKCGNLEGAQRTFETMSERSVVSWSTIIALHAKNKLCTEAFRLFRQMQQVGVEPNQVTFVSVLDACAGQGNLAEGKWIHAQIMNNWCEIDVAIENSLINMYGKCGSVTDAQKIFHRMQKRDVISWNTMITAYASQGMGKESVQLFYEMQQGVMMSNVVTLVSILDACMSHSMVNEGKCIHTYILNIGFESGVNVGTALVNMYSKFGSLEDAWKAFDGMTEQNVVSWTAMIAACAEHSDWKKAIYHFDQMQEEGVQPNKLTFTSILSAFSNKEAIAEGKQVCACILVYGFESDVMVGNAIVSMFGKCGCKEEARMMFDRMPERDTVSWNSMIAVYALHGQIKEAFQLLKKMQWEGLALDQVTSLSIIGACSSQSLAEGMWLHCNVLDSGCKQNLALGTALLKMYGLCGSPKDALKVFNEMAEHDAVSWTAMIAVYALHGQAEEAFQLFNKMQWKGVTPNGITFSSIIAACSHTGSVQKAFECFSSMTQDYGISPELDHFVGMVDLLGRAGQVDEAEYLIHCMPLQPTTVPYMALLGACRQVADVKRGEQAVMQVLELNPDNPAPYIMLSNICTTSNEKVMAIF